jgi:hypothetical protein
MAGPRFGVDELETIAVTNWLRSFARIARHGIYLITISGEATDPAGGRKPFRTTRGRSKALFKSPFGGRFAGYWHIGDTGL